MSQGEIEEVVKKGVTKLGLKAPREVLAEISTLSQGLPYVTHLISLHTCRAACARMSRELTPADVQMGVRNSLNQWQQSVITTYHKATHSHQPDHLFREVLAACALAVPDATGYFTAASVRQPLRIITRKPYDIPSFARHLNEFTKAERGAILETTGATRKLRYRFASPLIKPYIIMRSVADGLISRTTMEEVEDDA